MRSKVAVHIAWLTTGKKSKGMVANQNGLHEQRTPASHTPTNIYARQARETDAAGKSTWRRWQKQILMMGQGRKKMDMRMLMIFLRCGALHTAVLLLVPRLRPPVLPPRAADFPLPIPVLRRQRINAYSTYYASTM